MLESSGPVAALLGSKGPLLGKLKLRELRETKADQISAEHMC